MFIKKTALGMGAILTTPRLLAIEPKDRLPDAGEVVYRFAVGGDLHYGLGTSPYVQHTDNFIRELNGERKSPRGLDLFFLNGDIVNDTTTMYGQLKQQLQSLEVPYYTTKGNHDYLSNQQTWEGIWGFPENHVVEVDDMAFVLADTSRGNNLSSAVYTPADRTWLTAALSALQDKKHVFIVMHIAQRMKGVEAEGYIWPRWGVGQFNASDAPEGEAVLATIESFPNVAAIFHGHNHHETGRYPSGGKPYFFCSRLGSNWGHRIGYRVLERYKDGTIGTYLWDMQNCRITNRHVVTRVAPVR